jgi:phosphohistidine phosphatase SixA
MKIPWYGCARIILAIAVASCASAQAADATAVVELLRRGGYVIVFRHAATHRDQADTDPLNRDNVAQQRQLSAGGRETARQLGVAFKALGIPIGKVYTSEFHRAVETGQLISGSEVIPTAALTEGGLVITPIENDRRAQALRGLVATTPDAGSNTLVVTHKPNILDAFGKDWFEVKEGEATVFRPDTSTKPNPIARLQATDWLKAVR